ncbi:hypothetical protein UFOVP726_24 [uncultured Caudovirales phage]|uniref:Uncharacterized protein n=1 Tax=uncultured Caudovirales phage TaxID=2100421 RepID=A0A6J5NPU8_9CAUD|nr:hypothetical protein UFOVP726_24 [uncultured Caudovirales phage]
MKRPAFQFYPGDWRNDLALRKCSLAARGMWVEIMCIAHECEPYGTLRHNGEPLRADDIAGLVGMCSPREAKALIDELVRKGVAKLDADGVIYSKRMVRDEEIRNARAEGGKAGGEHGAKGAEHGVKGGRPTGPKGVGKGGSETPLPTAEKPPPSSSSSTSTSSPDGEEKEKVDAAAPTAPPPAPPLKAKDLEAEGVDPQAAADWLALRKAKRLPLTLTAWEDTKAEGLKAGLTPPQTVAKAVANNWAGFKAAWLQRDGVVTPLHPAGPVSKPDAVAMHNAAVGLRFLERVETKP